MARRSYLSGAVLALVAAGASAPVIMDQFIREKESSDRYELVAYQEAAHIWTVCDGKTEGVTSTTVMTPAQCDEWRKTEIAKRLAFAKRTIKIKMSEPAWAGVGSWCFNVGNGACGSSTAVRLLNTGNRAAGCDAMLRFRYITRNGRKIDCSQPQPYCTGVWDRRLGERELCLI